MITQRIDLEEEFFNPNVNYEVLMGNLRNKILMLEEDINNIKDPEVKGFAENKMIELRKEYFNFLKIDLELQHLVLSNPEIYNKEE